ncbi:DUF5403 family protein [Thalassiella azotivora]
MAQVYRTAGIEAARIAGHSPDMDAGAAKVLATAKRIAAQHRVTGAYMARFGVATVKGKRGVLDREVYNDDPASMHIEKGHRARGGGRWVQGLHILARAAGQTR